MIEQWLYRFHEAWKVHDVDAVLELFTDDVEYWETPHKPLHGKDMVRKEWQAIYDQENIEVTWNIYSSSLEDNRHTVVWRLCYLKYGAEHRSSGVYLISLNDNNVCNYFYYVGEMYN